MHHLRLLVVLIEVASVTRANDCTIPPLVLAIKNNTLSGDGIALNRGIAAKFGDGKQIEGLRLDFTRNNTGLRNSLDCSTGSQSTISQCIGASGGVFIINASTSFNAATSDSWNVTSIDASPNGAHITYGYDTVTFGPNDTIPSFPFDVWSDTTSANRSSLGMGRNSSVLSSLLGAGVIPSPEFGLYYGSRSMNNPSDGELVIGGYNSNRVNGTFANFSMATSYLDQPCPLQVLLKDVRVTTSNGSSSSLMADGEARVPACINPVENGFQFTPAMYKVWAGLTQHPSNPPSDGSHNYTQQTYPLSSEPLMNELIIQLEGWYQVTIPHYELVSFERGNDAQGLYAVINSSRIQSAVTDTGGRFTYPVLGGVFLSQNYLNVDYNRNVFGLAHAITSIPSNDTVTSTCSGGTQEIELPPSPSTNSTPSASPSSGSTLSTGAIVGVAIGSAAGLILLVAAAVGLFFYRKNRRTLPFATRNSDGDTTAHLSPDMSMTGSASVGTRTHSAPDASQSDSAFRQGHQQPQEVTAELPSPSGSPNSPQPVVERWDDGMLPKGIPLGMAAVPNISQFLQYRSGTAKESRNNLGG
ncbi:uncharacterized protein PAC_05890 [Phialocephala subalpina]|uniref:Peptidase A1 domain-containing protein n=1 Tax=Phialocephala subalpina TaxID=576137 RepID=A0A1L7WT96_9HELO|nr:uncharacterized protein PAC_05890 [Phialocephala subalpina]